MGRATIYAHSTASRSPGDLDGGEAVVIWRRTGRWLVLCLLLAARPVPGYGQSAYVHPSLGTLRLDIDPILLGVEVDEGILLEIGLSYPLAERVMIEARYSTSGFDVRGSGFESIPGRFHFVGAGVRVVVLDTRWLGLGASLSPGLLVVTVEAVDPTRNFAAPVGLDVVIPSARRVRLRAGVQDLLHRCDSPPGFEGIICDDGEWLHHVAATVGVEIGI